MGRSLNAAPVRRRTYPAWDWDYEVASLRLSDLYKKAVEEQWEAAGAIDWSQPVDPSRPLLAAERNDLLGAELFDRLSPAQKSAFVAGFTAQSFSQVLHGEQAALIVSSHLVASAPTHDVKLCAAVQTMDEARHVEVFSRYVRRLGHVHSPAPALLRIIDKIVGSRLWQAEMVGMQVVVEGLAMATFASVRKSTTCRVLADLLDLVMKDEARHMAFGRIGLADQLQAMTPAERAEVEDFACDIVGEYRRWGSQPEDLISFCQLLIEVGIDPTDMLASLMGRLKAGRSLDLSRGLRDGLETIILPNLFRLGLITDRVRELYEAADVRLQSAIDVVAEVRDGLLR